MRIGKSLVAPEESSQGFGAVHRAQYQNNTAATRYYRGRRSDDVTNGPCTEKAQNSIEEWLLLNDLAQDFLDSHPCGNFKT